jgi:hypothetical protein
MNPSYDGLRTIQYEAGTHGLGGVDVHCTAFPDQQYDTLHTLRGGYGHIKGRYNYSNDTTFHCTTIISVFLIYLRTGQDRTRQDRTEQSTQYNADHGSGTRSVLSHADIDSILDDSRQDRTGQDRTGQTQHK